MIGHYITASIELETGTIRCAYSLARLGIVAISDGKWPIRPEFEQLEQEFLQLRDVQKFVDDSTGQPRVGKSGIYLTPIGKAFVKVCLRGPTPVPRDG